MKAYLIALALLAALGTTPARADEAASAPTEKCILLSEALKGIPESTPKIPLTDDQFATVRHLAIAGGSSVPAVVTHMLAVYGELTDTYLIVGLTAADCVDGATLVSARTWTRIVGTES